jgi:hypothetical protein
VTVRESGAANLDFPPALPKSILRSYSLNVNCQWDAPIFDEVDYGAPLGSSCERKLVTKSLRGADVLTPPMHHIIPSLGLWLLSFIIQCSVEIEC